MKSIQLIAHFLLILVLGSLVAKEGAFIFVPFLWGVFFAFALYPISSWFENHRIPRGISIFLSLTLISVLAFAIFYLLLNQVLGLIRDIPEIEGNVSEKLVRYTEQLSYLLGERWPVATSGLELTTLFKFFDLNQTLFATGKSLTLIGIVPLYTFLLLYYKDFFTEFLVRYSSANQQAILYWVRDSGEVIQSYLAGMIRVTGIVAILAGLFFYAIGIKFFLLFAVFIALMNLIPYVGVFLSSIFVIGYVFLITDNLGYPILTFVSLWGIQLLENNLITPLVVGSKVKVNALVVILAVLFGGWLWGISGMVLFIPLVGVIKITLERIPEFEAFGFLLSDAVPVRDGADHFWTSWKEKIKFWRK
ncbi:MAG: AI-2E family transporter [Algoriphagus sp.]|jgi:predicted PurR-regulated permease PerM|uniref:AI-2E family transporter n=1 Tax=Algoriphagus sp. TaxID=1872435 RepID=UPI0027776B4E|nr:AI-2E family transporter [Algoriphagus sp.]